MKQTSSEQNNKTNALSSPAQQARYVTQPNKKKLLAVEAFVKLIKEYPIIGVLNMQDLPAKQLASMRKKMRGDVIIQMTK